jgi:hypothetical protein
VGKKLVELLPESAGSLLEDELQEAIRTKQDMSFEISIEHSPLAGRYNVFTHSHADGISVLFKHIGGSIHAQSPDASEPDARKSDT